MEYVAPVAGAIGGFIVGGPEGAAVGWALGSVLFPFPVGEGSIGDPSKPSFNQALRGSPVYVSYGTNRIDAQIVWTKNFTSVRTGTAYSYSTDVVYHFGMVSTPGAKFGRIWKDGNQLSSQATAALGGEGINVVSTNYSFPDSRRQETVTFGDVETHRGDPTGVATPWAYFTAQTLRNAGAWPHTCWTGIQGLDLGAGTSIPQLSVEIGPSSTELDVNPVFIIRDIFTNTVYGIGFNQNRFDTATYSAAFTHCKSEGLYLSAVFKEPKALLDSIADLLFMYDGYLVDHAGTIKFGFASSADVSVRTLDNSHFLVEGSNPPVSVDKSAIQAGYNKIKVNYIDRSYEYKQNTVQASDEVDIDVNGVRPYTYPAKFVMNGTVAYGLAEKKLWTNLYGRDTYRFKLGAKDADLSPGDVVTLVDTNDPGLNAGVDVRITRWEESDRLEFNIEGIRHVPYHLVNSTGFTQESSVDIASITNALPNREFRMYELPKEFQGAQAKTFVSYFPDVSIKGIQLHISYDGGTYNFADQFEPYIVEGVFGAAMPSGRPHGYPERKIPIYLFPNTLNIATPTFTQSHAMSNVDASARAGGLGIIKTVAGEAMAMQGLTLRGQNHYEVDYLYRSVGGTSTGLVSSGSTKFTYHSDGVLGLDINENDIGQNIFYKVVPYDFNDNLVDISSITANEYTVKGTYWQPRLLGDNMTCWINQAAVVTGSVQAIQTNIPGEDAKAFFVTCTTGGSNILLDWTAAANDSGYGAGGYGNSDYGHFSTDIDTVGYHVVLTRPTSTEVYSTEVYTPHFEVTSALQHSLNFFSVGTSVHFDIDVYPFNKYTNISSINRTSARIHGTVKMTYAGGGGLPITNLYSNQSGTETVPSGAVGVLISVGGGGGGGGAGDGFYYGGGGGEGGQSVHSLAIDSTDWGTALNYFAGVGGDGGNYDVDGGYDGTTSTVTGTLLAGTINVHGKFANGGGSSGNPGAAGDGGQGSGGNVSVTTGDNGGNGGAKGEGNCAFGGDGGNGTKDRDGANGQPGKVQFDWT